jgi:hypothetical protein
VPGEEKPELTSKDAPVTIKRVSQHILLSGFGGRKAPNGMSKMASPGSFDSAPQALCHAIRR